MLMKADPAFMTRILIFANQMLRNRKHEEICNQFIFSFYCSSLAMLGLSPFRLWNHSIVPWG